MDEHALRMAVMQEVRLLLYRDFKNVNVRETAASIWSIQVAVRGSPMGQERNANPQYPIYGTAGQKATTNVYVQFSDEYVVVSQELVRHWGAPSVDQAFREKGGISIFDPDFLELVKRKVRDSVDIATRHLKQQVTGGIDPDVQGDWRKQLRRRR